MLYRWSCDLVGPGSWSGRRPGPASRTGPAQEPFGELRRRLDAYLARVQAAQPYLPLSRAAVIRTLLDKGLSADGA